MKLAVVPTLTLVTACYGLGGCASIVSGTQQSISVTAKSPESADIPGATCSFENGKGKWFAPAPGSVTVHRAYSALIVHCDHPDWIGDTEAKSTTKAMAFGNILFGGVIGVGVDVGTGAAYDYPQLVTIPMKARVAAAPAAAAGDVAVTSLPASVKTPNEPTVAAATPVAISQPVPEAPATVAQAVALATPATPTALPAQTAPTSTPPPAVAAAPPLAPAAQAPVARTMGGGQDGYTAWRLARDAACHPQPTAAMTAKGPGFEHYTVSCTNGDALAIRCEWGNCRILR